MYCTYVCAYIHVYVLVSMLLWRLCTSTYICAYLHMSVLIFPPHSICCFSTIPSSPISFLPSSFSYSRLPSFFSLMSSLPLSSLSCNLTLPVIYHQCCFTLSVTHSTSPPPPGYFLHLHSCVGHQHRSLQRPHPRRLLVQRCYVLLQDRHRSGCGRHPRGTPNCHHHLSGPGYQEDGTEECHCEEFAVSGDPWMYLCYLL